MCTDIDKPTSQRLQDVRVAKLHVLRVRSVHSFSSNAIERHDIDAVLLFVDQDALLDISGQSTTY